VCKIARYENRNERCSKWGLGLYDDISELLGANTRSEAIDGACLFIQQMPPTLAKAVEHPDMTEELAEVLATPTVNVEYCVETGVNTGNLTQRILLDSI
jgi:hypothetical protein